MQNVKQILESEFGTKVTTQENIVKTTVKTINGNNISNLSDIYFNPFVKEVLLKRSGTGLTIIVTFE